MIDQVCLDPPCFLALAFLILAIAAAFEALMALSRRCLDVSDLARAKPPWLLRWDLVFNAFHSFAVNAHFNRGIDQLFPCQLQNGRLEQGTLDAWGNVRDDYDQAGVQLHFAEEPHKVDALVRDEREFILDDSLGQFQSGLPLKPRWLTWVASKPAP